MNSPLFGSLARFPCQSVALRDVKRFAQIEFLTIVQGDIGLVHRFDSAELASGDVVLAIIARHPNRITDR